MLLPSRSATLVRTALPLLAAALLWLAAATVDRRTELVIDSLGGHLRFTVAETELVVPAAVHSVESITLWSAESIDTPRFRSLELIQSSGRRQLLTPGDLTEPSRSTPPVGDWWVDGRTPSVPVAEIPVDLGNDFELRAIVTGRTASEAALTITGDPTLHFAFRRGIMDNYLVVRNETGSLLAVTTLDPTPAADSGALLAQLLRAVAAACLAIAFFGLVALVRPDSHNSNQSTTGNGLDPVVVNRLAPAAAVVLAVVAVVASVSISAGVLAGIPHQIDEVVYLLQARWLLDGEVAPAATAIQQHLQVPFTYLVDGRWIGHYPVGWPALLAAGLAVGLPNLVAPVLSGIFVLLVFLVGRELDDGLTGLAAASLATSSPLIRMLGATFFPHMACAALVTLALWLILLAERRPTRLLGVGVGLTMGCCLAVRPMPAVAVAVGLGCWWLLRAARSGDPRRWAVIAAAVGSGLIASVPTLAHNAATTGSPWQLPYSLADGAMYDLSLIPFGIRNLDAILASGSANAFGWGWPVFTGGLALALPLAFVAISLLLRRARPADALLVALLLIVALGHLPTRAHGLHGFGARYMVDIGACWIVLSARGFRELARWARPSRLAAQTVAGVFVLLNLWTLATLVPRADLYRGYDGVTGTLERQLAASGADTAVILLDSDSWRPWAEAVRTMTGARRHEIAIGADLDDNRVMERAYPDRPLFRWDGAVLHRENRAQH